MPIQNGLLEIRFWRFCSIEDYSESISPFVRVFFEVLPPSCMLPPEFGESLWVMICLMFTLTVAMKERQRLATKEEIVR